MAKALDTNTVDAARFTNWSSTEWEQAVDENIVQGSLRLVVAADHVHPKLHECLGAWNSSLTAESYEAVWALELLRIVHSDSEFLIPQITVPRSASASRVSSFDETLRIATGAGRAVDGRVVQWAKGNGLGIRTTTVSRQVIGRDGQRLITLYLNPTIDKLKVNLEPIPAEDGARRAIRTKIGALFGDPVAETYPNISLEAVNRLWDPFAASVLEDFESLREASPR